MSTPEQPLTRKQMRELVRTGAIPIVRPPEDDEADAADASEAALEVALPASPPPQIPDAEVDLDAMPLTRREARQQERLRTASVPIISPELAAAAVAAGRDDDAESEGEPIERVVEPAESVVELVETTESEELVEVEPVESVVESVETTEPEELVQVEPVESVVEPVETTKPEDAAEADPDAAVAILDDEDEVEAEIEAAAEAEAEIAEEPAVAIHAGFGEHLLLDDPQLVAQAPTSFDQLIARGSSATGTATATNALILSQTPSSAPLDGAVTATGEILITGTLSLPEGLGSTGQDPRLSDGKEIDALLVDGGELPASSSPTPVAASSAISTIKSAGEIIKPPVPEKGSRLMFALAITAGALALALVGVLILGFITGAL